MRLAATVIGAAVFAALATPSPAATHTRIVKKTVVVRKTVSPDSSAKMEVSGDPQAKAIVTGCGARHFETNAEVVDGGQKRLTKIKLCAKPGEDDAMWVKSLQQAAKTIDGTDRLAVESRAKIVAALNAEIIRVQASIAAQPGVIAPATEKQQP